VKALLLQTLKEQTLALHLEAERKVTLLESTATEHTYRAYLRMMLGFYEPLERRFETHEALHRTGFDAPSRRKAKLLEADLRALGDDVDDIARLPRCQKLPDLTELPEALGCAYVLEGSTLGGQFILRKLQGHLGQATAVAQAFLNAYGPRTGPMWREFGEVISRSVPETDWPRTVQGAQGTFVSLIEWMELNAR